MAIRVLLDHGVRQDRIIFVTFLVAQGGGVAVLHRAFPQVKIVTGAVDEQLREAWLDEYNPESQSDDAPRKCWIIEPGMGQIGMVILSFVLCLSLNLTVSFRRSILFIDIYPLAICHVQKYKRIIYPGNNFEWMIFASIPT